MPNLPARSRPAVAPAPGPRDQDRPETLPLAAVPPAAAPGTADASERARESRRTWVRADRLLSAEALADPRSRQAREALPTLAGADRREQICALEAMEQVRLREAGFRPTRLAPHAFRNSVLRDGVVQVTAGALRSQRQWFEIAYRCRLDPSGRQVIEFEYALGAPVDRALWEEHGLAPVH